MRQKTNGAFSLQVNDANAVYFNKNNNGCDTFTFSVTGDEHDYIETMQALLKCLGSIDDDFISRDDRYVITNLLIGMLPDASQIISLSAGTLLQQLKAKKGGAL